MSFPIVDDLMVHTVFVKNSINRFYLATLQIVILVFNSVGVKARVAVSANKLSKKGVHCIVKKLLLVFYTRKPLNTKSISSKIKLRFTFKSHTTNTNYYHFSVLQTPYKLIPKLFIQLDSILLQISSVNAEHAVLPPKSAVMNSPDLMVAKQASSIFLA